MQQVNGTTRDKTFNTRPDKMYMYSKTRLKRLLKNRQNKDLKDK